MVRHATSGHQPREPFEDILAAQTSTDIDGQTLATVFVDQGQHAKGTTIARGAEELRVKESDRITAMAEALGACGVACEEFEDGMAVTGTGGDPIPGGATIATQLDHRIAMSMTIAALNARDPITLDDAAPVATSYPVFFDTLEKLGAFA